jgi:hypothetical protein
MLPKEAALSIQEQKMKGDQLVRLALRNIICGLDYQEGEGKGNSHEIGVPAGK